MRAIWKGHIQFSLVTIPVRLYNALDTAQSISFNLLTKEGHNPVSYEKKDKVTGRPLRAEDIVKGYQYQPGQYVIIEQEDLDKIKLKSTRVVEIESFVAAQEVHPTLFETPYFLGPDGEVAAKTYGLLVETLRQTGKVGVGKFVLRDRETPVLISPQEGGLLLYRLRYPAEVRSIAEVPQLVDVKADKEQLKLARTLVDSMTTTFSGLKMKDHYYEAVKAMIDAKVEGKEVVMVAEEEAPVVDIMTALKESLARTKQKPMQKATGKGTASAQARRKAG